MTTEAGQALGASAEAPNTAPEQPAEKPADQAGGERAVNQDPQADDSKLNALQRFSKQSAERKAAKLAGVQSEKDERQAAPEKPAAKAEKPVDDKVDAKPKADAKDASEAPERDANGRFVGKDKPDAKPDEKAAAGAKEPARPKPDDGKDEPPPAAAKAPEAKQEPAKEPTKEPTKHEQYERRIAELLREKKNWDAERLEHKRNAEKSGGETKAKLERLAQLERLLERARSDELDDDVLEPLIGRGFVKLVQDINAGKEKGGIAYKARAPVPPELQPLAKELQEQLAEVRAWKQGEEQRKREAEAARARAEHEAKRKSAEAQDAEACKAWLADKAEKYPYLTALPDAATQYRDTLYAAMRDANGELTGPEPDYHETAEMIEQHLSDKLDTVFANEYALKRALRDPKTRELVSRLLAAEAATTTQEPNSPQRENKGEPATGKATKGPPTLSSKVTQEAPVAAEAPDEFEDPDGYRAWWRENFRKGNRNRNAAIAARTRGSQAAE